MKSSIPVTDAVLSLQEKIRGQNGKHLRKPYGPEIVQAMKSLGLSIDEVASLLDIDAAAVSYHTR